jgi:hypothetical protein
VEGYPDPLLVVVAVVRYQRMVAEGEAAVVESLICNKNFTLFIEMFKLH